MTLSLHRTRETTDNAGWCKTLKAGAAIFAASMFCGSFILPLTQASAAAPLLQPGKHSLYQRAITKPGAMLAPNAQGPATRPLEGFRIFYVFDRKSGRVAVASSAAGPIEGWIDETRTIPWSHTLIATFTNPAGRNRALFLKTADDERALLNAPDPGGRASTLAADAFAGRPGPVIAVEPENAIDISKSFYLLPILDVTTVLRDSGPSVRMLHVVSAPSSDGSRRQNAQPESLSKFKAGLVFVIDTTESMQPYIEQTRDAVKGVIHAVQDTAVAQNFRFGLVGYRDSTNDTPGLEYATRLFASPDFSKPIDAVLPQIANVHDATASSSSFDEDPVAGIKTAIDQVNWDGLGGRYMVLITDAGARDGSDPHSVTHMGIKEIRRLAADKGIALFVIHLLTPAGDAAHDHARASMQYRTLSTFDSAGNLYYPVPGGAPQAFRPVVQQLTTSLMQAVADTTGRPVAGLTPKGSAPDPKLAVVAQAMRLAYLGNTQSTAAPDAIESYTSDRDPADALHRAIEIRVLLTRNQLSDLAQSLQHVLDAGLAGRIAPDTFFTRLQSAFAASARDPSKLSRIDSLDKVLGEYLDGLPYRSEVASITPETWLAMGAISQRTILNNIASRLRLYQEYEAHPELWVQLAGNHDPGEAVYPVPLDALP